MSLRFKAPLLATAVLGSFGFATVAHAQAFYLQEQSARGAGRAFSGEVADTGPQSLWWNPASIAGMERGEAAINASGILPKGKVVNNGTLIQRTPAGQYAAVGGDQVSRNPIDKGLLPSGAIAMPFGPVAIGLAVTSPYSFTTDYDSTSWTRYSATRTKLQTIDIQPSIAIALTDWLRVGGAANVEHVYASLGNALPNLSAALPDGRQRLEGDGWDLGWSAGVQLHNDWATVGISYKSRIEHTLKGDLLVEGLVGPLATQNRTLNDIEASFYTPAQTIVGARIRATPALTLNGQAVRYNWSKFDAIRLGAPLNSALPENYRDSYSLAGGLDYAVSPQLTLRAGVQRATTPTQDGLRDARVPDANRWNYGAGGTFQITPKFGIDLAANYVDFEDTTIDRRTAAYVGTAAQTNILTNGRLEGAHAVVVSAGAHVGF
ncbi:outer membrane protein transport protein [Sphingomonas sp. RP10(2022)]|uniref:Outer membrane protein transport protein n=1 Tax=Sphingomonas liriopis TaxID=2949094 RepID=A0A9X2KPA3_9SPHN|nr:outer membrane protein transport protein [Sphingomonas liriopis]MCP3733722.1 outer membrane protein transport protein [Sphingomonas liriopis]